MYVNAGENNQRQEGEPGYDSDAASGEGQRGTGYRRRDESVRLPLRDDLKLVLKRKADQPQKTDGSGHQSQEDSQYLH